MTPDEDAAFRAAVDGTGPGPNGPAEAAAPVTELQVVTLDEFVAVDEQGEAPLLGEGDDALVGENGDVMVYGDGGAGKTTLVVDLALHLAAGDPWLGIAVARPVRVLIVENEGPRALFRAKLRRKLGAWTGSPVEDRVRIVKSPWAGFTFIDESWRSALAARLQEDEIDVLIAGPVTRLGMDDAGTLQQVRDFMRLVSEVRRASDRRLVVILVHHENKGGTVSGAWEGACDTLLHVEERGNGHTGLHVQKARWSSKHHGARLELVWTDGEGFKVEGERDYHAEITALLADGRWRTPREIATKKDAPENPGIGASLDTVKEKLVERGDLYVQRAGKDVGRSANAKAVYSLQSLNSGQSSHASDSGSQGTAETGLNSESPLRDSEFPGAVPTGAPESNSRPGSDAADPPDIDRPSGPQPAGSSTPGDDLDPA
jgi:predicted ATP-dependent serine protease